MGDRGSRGSRRTPARTFGARRARRPGGGPADAQRAEGERRPEPERERSASARSGKVGAMPIARASVGPDLRLIPVGGGKGGVGKTFLVANLAAGLARQGYRVVAVDADLEGANLHTCLGVPRPRCSLADFVAHREEDLPKLVIETPFPN